jgi:hypothetical protein
MIGRAVRVMRLPKAERIWADQSRLKLALRHRDEERLKKSNIWRASGWLGRLAAEVVGVEDPSDRHGVSRDQAAGLRPGAELAVTTLIGALSIRKRASF